MAMEYQDNANLQVKVHRKHSLFGIASFIASMTLIFFVILLIVAAVYFEVFAGGMPDNERLNLIVGLFFILGALCSLVGIALGIAGLFERNKKKLFSILGVTLNSVSIIVVIILIAIGVSTR